MRAKWKCVRSHRLIYSAARRFLIFIGSTANSLGAKGYLGDRCIVSAPGKRHKPPLTSRRVLAEALASLGQVKAMDP